MWILTLDISFKSFAKKPVFLHSGPKFLPRCVNLKIFFYVFQASNIPRQPLKGQHLEKCEKNSKSLHLSVYQSLQTGDTSSRVCIFDILVFGGKGGIRQIVTCRKVHLQVNFLDDDMFALVFIQVQTVHCNSSDTLKSIQSA